jgi:1,4-alpha-glucan branching enzyme
MIKKRESKKGSPKKRGRKRVTFELSAPDAQNVVVAGDFNSWSHDAHPLKKCADGTWKGSVTLSPGRYEYRFVVDGAWCGDPCCTTFVPNPYGSENCVLLVE